MDFDLSNPIVISLTAALVAGGARKIGLKARWAPKVAGSAAVALTVGADLVANGGPTSFTATAGAVLLGLHGASASVGVIERGRAFQERHGGFGGLYAGIRAQRGKRRER